MDMALKCLMLLSSLTVLLHVGVAEYCIDKPFKRCDGYPSYCCKNDVFNYEYCCNICEDSVHFSTRATCNVSNDFVSIIGGVVGAVIILVIIVVLIVLCCFGCICSSLTGRTRRGRVPNRAACTGVGVGGYSNPTVSVITTHPPQAGTSTVYPQQVTGYPPQGTGYPQQGTGYPQQGTGYPPQGTGYPQQGTGYPQHSDYPVPDMDHQTPARAPPYNPYGDAPPPYKM